MTIEHGMLSLVGRIYDAPLERLGWNGCIERIADALGGSSAILVVLDRRNGTCEISAPERLDPADLELYAEYCAERDVWLPRAFTLPTGTVFTGSSVVATNAFLASEHYNNFLRRQDAFHICAAILFNDRERMGFLSVFRPRQRDDFESSKQALLGKLAPHVRRAVQIDLHLRRLEGLQCGLAEALERFGQAILFVDNQGRVLFANHTAELFLHDQDGLNLRDGRLAAASTADTDALRRLIAGAAHTMLGSGMDAGGALSLARPSGKRPLIALVSPSAQSAFGMVRSDIAAIVFVDDPERRTRPREDLLMALYRLTAAEARLATAMVGGATLKDYAREAAITMNTARWTLSPTDPVAGLSR